MAAQATAAAARPAQAEAAQAGAAARDGTVFSAPDPDRSTTAGKAAPGGGAGASAVGDTPATAAANAPQPARGRIPVLRRKAAGGRLTLPETGEPRLARRLRRALARAAEADCGLALAAGEVRPGVASLAELLEQFEPRALLAVLEGPGEMLGLCALGPQLLSALIEQQTTGTVLPAEAPPRKPTRTDAAMAAGVIDHMLTEMDATAGEPPDPDWPGGFRYASFLDDPRPLGLLLEDIAYRVIRVAVELGGVARRGSVLLALPADPPGGRPARPAGGAAGAIVPSGPGAAAAAALATRAAARAEWEARMEATVMASPATLEAVLARLKLPLASILDWKEGDLVVLPDARLERVTLEGPGGRGLVRVRLGQSRGQRALRLAEDAAGPALPGIGDGMGLGDSPGLEPLPMGLDLPPAGG